MSIISCDQHYLSSISPRRIVSRKRLRQHHNISMASKILICILNTLILLNPVLLHKTRNPIYIDQISTDIIKNLNDTKNNGISSNSNSISDVIIGNSNDAHLFHNLESSVGAVLKKVAYGTTSTTKRSIPDNSYVPSLTTSATPPLTTFRYIEKTPQHQINFHHRNYEFDLEKDHALPTSAPNADILKSNSNPTYPNPNRHHSHDKDRHRHFLNSTPSPSIHNSKKGFNTNPVSSGEIPLYSPPARTPPLPPEYQNPFADKPTLRGTNNDGEIIIGSYINRKPIPPPSLTPNREQIPLRPPQWNGGNNNNNNPGLINTENISKISVSNSGSKIFDNIGNLNNNTKYYNEDGQRKKVLNTPSQKINNKVDDKGIFNTNKPNDDINNNIGIINQNNDNDTLLNSDRRHIPNISRMLSGSNGRKEDIADVLLRTVTGLPNYNLSPSSSVKQPTLSLDGKISNINQNKDIKDGEIIIEGKSRSIIKKLENDETINSNEKIIIENDDKQLNKIQINIKSTELPINKDNTNGYYSTNDQNYGVNHKSLLLTTKIPNIKTLPTNNNNNNNNKLPIDDTINNVNKIPSADKNDGIAATWSVAWNIHVYLSAILFTILAVYSIFKLIFYDKLAHLLNQCYFICIHLILISVCMSRIFYLCYDAYNIHSTFHTFISEILLNLPATFLTISFSILILFLLIRSLNHKNNHYSALIRPLTIVVGSCVHVGLCITLHYVENYTASNPTHYQALYYQQLQHQQQQQQHQQQFEQNNLYKTNYLQRNLITTTNITNFKTHHNFQPPPRVLSLICQIIYIFVCLSLGLLYLYIYKVLKRILRSKSQNYIHGYQNLSYAIHITIATALLFILLAALQIYGAISISTTRPLITSSSEIDWLQWGYQFSLRLIEIAIITLISWVAGLKTGVNSNVLQREKINDTHNVSGFALFPCTSSSSQEHFETDYPAVCNANTNLHTYTLRTGKPIYDDNFALNSLSGSTCNSEIKNCQNDNINNTVGRTIHPNNDFEIQNTNDFTRSYEVNSIRSSSAGGRHYNRHIHKNYQQRVSIDKNDLLVDSTADHYENPNFELRSNKSDNYRIDNCYSEPLNSYRHNVSQIVTPVQSNIGYEFQNFERPLFYNNGIETRTNQRNGGIDLSNTKQTNKINKIDDGYLERSNFDNPERRSSNSAHSCTSSVRNYPIHNNSFERRSIRKSGTLNNVGSNNIIHARNSSTSSTSSCSRPSGVQTLSSSHNRTLNGNCQGPSRNIGNNSTGGGGNKLYYRDKNQRSSLERNIDDNGQQYILPSDDDLSNPERINLIKSTINGSGAIINSTSGGNLTDNCNIQQHLTQKIPVNNVGCNGSGSGSSSSESATSGSMLVAENGFVRFRALDDINNAQGIGIHNASIRTSSRSKEKRFTNNT